MRLIGFSSGALAKDDFRAALRILNRNHVTAVELSALRQNELSPLISALDGLDLKSFKYVSFHAPSSIETGFEGTAISLLKQVADRRWPIVIHPDAMHDLSRWECLGNALCIENMDKRKSIGQTARQLATFFDKLPEASLCFDMGHARQVDPTMGEAMEILCSYKDQLRQVHISEVNSQSRHDPLSFESVLAFRKIAHLVPEAVPVIVESRVDSTNVREEIKNVRKALSLSDVLATASD
jgi:hypothetical protein